MRTQPNPRTTLGDEEEIEVTELVERYPHELRVSFDGGQPVKAIIEGIEFIPADRIERLEAALREIEQGNVPNLSEMVLGGDWRGAYLVTRSAAPVTEEMVDAGEQAYDAEPEGYGAHRRALRRVYLAMQSVAGK